MRRAFCFSRSWSRYSLSLVRPRPCSPGGYGRISIGHFGDSHLLPLRNSFIFSRRQRLQSAPVYLAITSNPPPLRWAAAIVRNWGHVLNGADLEADRLQAPDGGLTAGAGTLHEHVDLAHAVLLRATRGGLGGPLRGGGGGVPGAARAPPTRGGLGGHLRGEGRRLPGALEAHLAGARPGDHVAQRVGDRDDRVVERALDVGVPVSDVLLLFAAHLLRGRLLRCARHYFFPTFFLPATVLRGPLRVRALVWVR